MRSILVIGLLAVYAFAADSTAKSDKGVDVADRISDLRERIVLLSADGNKKTAELEALKLELLDLNAKRRPTLRERLMGKKIARLETVSGKIYEDVVIVEVLGPGLRFNHSGGKGRIRFVDLSPELQDQLGLEKADDASDPPPITRPKRPIKPVDRLTQLAQLESHLASLPEKIAELEKDAKSYSAKAKSAESKGRKNVWAPRAAEQRSQAEKLRQQMSLIETQIAELRADIESGAVAPTPTRTLSE